MKIKVGMKIRAKVDVNRINGSFTKGGIYTIERVYPESFLVNNVLFDNSRINGIRQTGFTQFDLIQKGLPQGFKKYTKKEKMIKMEE